MGEAKKKSGSRWGKLFGVSGTNLSQLNLKEDENVPSDLHHDAVSQLPAKETGPTLIQTSTESEDELASKQENDSVPPLRVYANGTSKSQNGHASHNSANASSTTNGSSSSPKSPSNGHAEAANITNITASMAGNISPMSTSSAENEQFLSFGTANKSKPIAPHTQSVTEDNLKKVNSSLLSANHAPPSARATSAPKRPSPTTSRSPSHGPSSKQTSPPPLSNLNGSNTASQVHLLSHPNKSNPPSRSSSTKLGKANIASAPSSASISNMSGSTAASVSKPRFKMLENGNHEHNLRCAKRQEKLSNMLKDLLGAQKLRDEAKSAVPNILSGTIQPSAANNQNKPPTLFAGLVNHVKNNTSPYHGGPSAFNAAAPSSSTVNVTSTVTYSTKDAEQEANEKLVHQSSSIGTNVGFTPSQDSRSFVEKYGRCNEVIGRGSFGVVRISHKKITGTGASNVSIQSSSQISSSGTAGQPNDEILYAVKEFKRKTQESDKKYNRRLTSEFCISSSLKHPNIIETLDLLKDAKGDYCEVMEYCSGGDLYTLIIASGKLEYAEADCFFKQLIRGVNYMHDMGVSHRDLKPENILLTQSGMVKITDFGNGECFRMAWEEEVQLSEGVCGSSPYIAPEEFTQQQFDPRCVDIWACGVIYMAMRTGRQLWKLANPKKDEFFEEYLEKRKDATGYEPIENLKRARCRNVIYSILDPKPDRRITGKQILNSEWGREIKVCSAGDDH